MTRKYYPYTQWEEYYAGMWRDVTSKEKKELLEKAIAFTGNHKLYGSFMQRVINEWPCSCEHNLTDMSQNRQAWIGHAATAMALECPEDVTRLAWGFLSQEQRDLANDQATAAIQEWERKNAEENKTIRHQLAIKGIL